MNIYKALVRTPVVLALLVTAVFAAHIKVDYDHHANFESNKSYTWGKVETANSLWDARVKEAINTELAAKGWTEVPSGGSVTVVAVKTSREKPELNTFYNGFGGWRWGGFSDATTTVQNYKIGTLVVDMFDTASKNLIWRGTLSDALSGNAEKNTKNMDKEVRKMFEHFPPKEAS